MSRPEFHLSASKQTPVIVYAPVLEIEAHESCCVTWTGTQGSVYGGGARQLLLLISFQVCHDHQYALNVCSQASACDWEHYHKSSVCWTLILVAPETIDVLLYRGQRGHPRMCMRAHHP